MTRRNVALSSFLLTLCLLVACNGETYSVMMQAARFGDTKGVWKYAADGFNVNEKTRQGKTPLILAATSGHAETVQALLDLGADIQAQDDNGASALIAAATGGHNETVRILLAKGANVAAKDRDGGTALLNAVFYGYHKVVAEILKHKDDIDAADLNEALLISAGMGYNDIVSDLIALNINVNVPGLNDRTPLMAAVKFGRVEMVKLLMQHGGDPTATDSDGNTALQIARDMDQKEILELLKTPRDVPVAVAPTPDQAPAATTTAK